MATEATAKKTAPKALTAPVFDTTGKKVKDLTLPAELFDIAWNPDLVHQVVLGMQSNARANTAQVKDRSEVSGGGKKPWRQKGTGRARHGSRRSPIWRGGGITFGPTTDRNYTKKISKKMRTKAFLSVLSQKLKDGEIIFVEDLKFDAPKTKTADALLTGLAKDAPKITKAQNAALIATPSNDENVKKSFANIKRAEVEEVRNLNPVDLLSNTYIVFVNPEEALTELNNRVG